VRGLDTQILVNTKALWFVGGEQDTIAQLQDQDPLLAGIPAVHFPAALWKQRYQTRLPSSSSAADLQPSLIWIGKCCCSCCVCFIEDHTNSQCFWALTCPKEKEGFPEENLQKCTAVYVCDMPNMPVIPICRSSDCSRVCKGRCTDTCIPSRPIVHGIDLI